MADCSAVGSAIDRTVSAAVSRGANVVDKASLSSLIGHGITSSSSSSSVMPLAPPTELMAPGAAEQAMLANLNDSSGAGQTTMMMMARPPSAEVLGNRHQRSQQTMFAQPPPMAMQHQPFYHGGSTNQQQMMIMMQMQQQQMQMMVQVQQQQQQQQQQQKASVSRETTEAAATSSTTTVKELKEKLKELDHSTDPVDIHVREEIHRLIHENEQRQQEARVNHAEHDGDRDGVTLDSWYDDLFIDEDGKLSSTDMNAGLAEGQADQATSLEDLAAAWARAEAEYEAAALEYATTRGATGTNETTTTTIPPLTEDQLYPYTFSTTPADHAAISSSPNRDWLQEGMDYYENGNVMEAIKSFETLLQVVDPDQAQGWFYLGKCHAENDMDRQAIACLERAVERDPYYSEALLALGVSYVNELNHEKALEALKNWITHNPEYAHLAAVVSEADGLAKGSAQGEDSHVSPEFAQVQSLLQRARDVASTANDSSGIADVEEALGVVYNVSRDYAKAIECFEQAIQHRPKDDFALHNKLGATLANSNQSADALQSYHRALRLRPKYARAWLNMAISHSNLQNYHESARCYLQTLALAAATSPKAAQDHHCWSYLRIALSCDERWDLLPLVAEQDLEAFTKHFDFVLQ